MEQEWRIYNSDRNGNSKVDLRGAFFLKDFLRISPLKCLTKEDCLDDCYVMDIFGEQVFVVARERGQRNFTKGVFDGRNSGIFYRVSDGNYRNAEGVLTRIFK